VSEICIIGICYDREYILCFCIKLRVYESALSFAKNATKHGPGKKFVKKWGSSPSISLWWTFQTWNTKCERAHYIMKLSLRMGAWTTVAKNYWNEFDLILKFRILSRSHAVEITKSRTFKSEDEETSITAVFHFSEVNENPHLLMIEARH